MLNLLNFLEKRGGLPLYLGNRDFDQKTYRKSLTKKAFNKQNTNTQPLTIFGRILRGFLFKK